MKMLLQKIKRAAAGCRPEFLTVSVLFLLAVLMGAGFLIFGPKLAFSDNENRALEEAPKISIQGLAEGSYMKSAQSFVNDHFLMRRSLVELNTMAQYALGRRDLGSNYASAPLEGGVYVGKNNNHLYEVLLPDTQGIFKQNLASLNQFAKAIGMPFYLMMVPSSAQEQADSLPTFAPSHNQREELEAAQQSAGENTVVLDMFDTLNAKNGDFYFKTDHHWNIDGAYEGYTALVNAMGKTPYSKSEFEFRSVEQPFYGTLYSKALLPWQQSDRMYLPYFKREQQLSQTVGKQERTGDEALYWKEYMTKKDKYSTFLGGNRSVAVIKNGAVKDGSKLLIIKDSYANSMAPFLATQFSELHIIDLRSYSQNIYQYIEDNGITQAAAVYSIKQLCDVSLGGKLMPRK